MFMDFRAVLGILSGLRKFLCASAFSRIVVRIVTDSSQDVERLKLADCGPTSSSLNERDCSERHRE